MAETTTDRHGSLGVRPLPSWTERWSSMSLDNREEYWRDVASWPLLNAIQMEQMIQGLLPQRDVWQSSVFVGDEFAPAVHRLRHDIAQGHLAKAATPAEFVAWSAQYRVQLPGAFVEALEQRPATSEALQRDSEATYVGPSWAPVMTVAASMPSKAPVRGRPKVTLGRNHRLVQAANHALLSWAEEGRVLTIREVAAELFGTPEAEGMKLSNIERQLKGKLNLEQSKSLATRVAKSRGKSYCT